MKIFLILFYIFIYYYKFQKNNWILNNKNLAIFADGVKESIILSKKPILNSWRKNKIEVNNMCKVIECRYNIDESIEFNFHASHCIIESDNDCNNQNEKHSVYKIEELMQNSDYRDEIILDGIKFGMISNSKNEEGIVYKNLGSNKKPDCNNEKEKTKK